MLDTGPEIMCLAPDKPLLGRDPLRFDCCKRPSTVSDHSVFAFWLVAYGRFDSIQLLNKPGRNSHHQRRNGYSLGQIKVEPSEYGEAMLVLQEVHTVFQDSCG